LQGQESKEEGEKEKISLSRMRGSIVSINTAQADKKASTFNHAKFSLVGNNSTGHNVFARNKRF
jgi:hypothetical protein